MHTVFFLRLGVLDKNRNYIFYRQPFHGRNVLDFHGGNTVYGKYEKYTRESSSS